MKFYKIYIILVLITLSISSCADKHTDEDGHNHQHEESAHEEGDEHSGHDDHDEHEEGLFLSKEQMKTVGVAFGEVSSIKINDYIKATGTLGLPPQSYASVSVKASGFIKNSNKYVEGSAVKKGAIMAFLENPEFIRQQQLYLEVHAELTYLRQELDRQQKLVNANAGVIKNLQKLQSEVNIKTATIKGVAKQLHYLGINVDKLTPDNIVERIKIIAPMSGFVTSINMHNGMYVTSDIVLMDIISERHIHLELDVFEKDISILKEEQIISYTVPALGTTVYEGEVHIIGKEFNRENKTVRIHGHLNNERPKFIKDLFVDAKIWLNNKTVDAIPEKAIIKDGPMSFVYAGNEKMDNDKVKFEKILVVPGITDKGFTSIKFVNDIPEGMRIVTEGAYFVYAQSKAGELAHEH